MPKLHAFHSVVQSTQKYKLHLLVSGLNWRNLGTPKKRHVRLFVPITTSTQDPSFESRRFWPKPRRLLAPQPGRLEGEDHGLPDALHLARRGLARRGLAAG